MNDFLIAGIDETNKGEVLNNLLVCMVYTKTNLKEIPYVGQSKNKIMSDKLLTEIIKKYDLKYIILEWPPKYLDKYNLNYLLYLSQIYLIKKLKIDLSYIDSIVPVGPRLKKLMTKYAHNRIKVICAPKLDEINCLVGIASLLAKRKKLKNLKLLESKVGMAVGSGNVNDPLTQKYIKQNYPNVIGLRKSWPLKFMNLPGKSKKIVPFV